MPGIFFLAPGAVFQDPNAQVVHSNATVTVTGEAIVTGYGATEVTLFINVKAAPTGTSPTLQYTIQEVDPGDGLTNIGPSVSSTVITGIGIQKISLVATFGGSIHVSWAVTGTTPSFTQVYATLVGKSGSIALVDSTGAAISSANPLRTDPTGSTTQPVSGTVTGNQGTPNTIGNSWPVEVTDGTNVLGTNTHPVRTDPTGTTTQPVSGTVTAQQATAANLNATVTQGPAATLAGYWTVRVTDGTNTMPTGDVVGRAIYHLLTDGTNTAAVTASSALKVDGSAVTQPVSGTVTSNQGTAAGAGAPWSIRLSDGAAFYDATKTGQLPAALVGGRLDANVGAWLGSTAPTVGQKTMANSVPIAIASDQTVIPVSQSGTWTVQQGTPPWSVAQSGTWTVQQGTPPWQVVGPGAAGSAVTGNPVIMGGSDGTNARYVSVDSSGRLVMVQATASLLNATVTQGPAAALSGYWPVRITDGTNTMPTMDAVARAGFQKLTDGTNGPAAVKAASTTPVAADPALVVVLSPNTPTISTTPAADQFPATQNITTQDTGSSTTTGANGQTIITGTPTANSAASFALVSQETCQIQVTGTWTGTLQVEVSVDNGTTWYVRRLHQVGTDIISASYTQNFSGAANTGAYTNIRVRATAAMTGTAVVKVTESVNNNSIYVANAVRITDNAGHYARMDTDGTFVITPRNDDGSIGTFNFGGDNRLRVGQESLLFFDTFEGNTVNNYLWTQSTSTMTQVQSSGVITLNNGNSTTNGAYSILTSTKSLFLTSEFPIYAQFKARLIPQTNAVIEMGFGTVATTAAPTNGCFFRIDSAGNMRAVINFGGTETTSATLGTLTSTNYYSFEVVIHEDSIRVDIDNADGTTFASVELPLPATQASLMTTSHIPLFARVYNSGTPTTAANILLSSVSVQQLDLAMVATWEEQMAGTGRGATADPQTGAQLQNFTNSAAPSTITVATLSNVTPAYTTFGGLFAFNTPAGSETDYLLFAYQIPDGFTAMIWAVQIGCVILGAQSSTNPTVLQWGIAVGSSAASLATGAPNPPIRQTLGFQQAPKTATIGDTYSPANLTYSPKVPLVCFGGKYVQIILRVVAGNATAGQINRGFVNIDGFFQ